MGGDFLYWNFPLGINLGMHPISPPWYKGIILIHKMPGLGSCVIPLDGIDMCVECEVVQSGCSIMASQGGVADHVPAGMEGDGLVLSWLGTIVYENCVSRFGDVDPESHGFV